MSIINKIPLLAGVRGRDALDFNWSLRASSEELRKTFTAGSAPWPDVGGWVEKVDPRCNQQNTTLGDCSFVNGMVPAEVSDYLATGEFRDIRADDVYLKALQIINGNQTDTGLQLPDMVRAAQQLGLLKPDIVVTQVEFTQAALSAALARGPLVCGVAALGIMPDDLDPRGYADESDDYGLDIMSAGGHCICAVAALTSNGLPTLVFKNKGWGAVGLLGQGMILMTVNRFIALSMCKPLLLTHFSNDCRGPKYEDYLK